MAAAFSTLKPHPTCEGERLLEEEKRLGPPPINKVDSPTDGLNDWQRCGEPRREGEREREKGRRWPTGEEV